MGAARGFSINIYLPDGDPEGFRIVGKSHWTGRALVIPHALLPALKDHDDLNGAGVYILVGPVEERELPMIYVGEGDPVKDRLQVHYSQKDFWTSVVVFVSSDRSINKAHVEYLEARLIGLAKHAKRCVLDNRNSPTLPSLAAPQRADAESFLDDMLSIYPLLGIRAFEQPVDVRKAAAIMLTLRAKGLSAQGFESPQGFVVKAGSEVAVDVTPSIHQYLATLRDDLIENGVLRRADRCLVFDQDYAFGSPSTAAGVVMGRTANGRVEWRDDKGQTLKELQAAAIGATDSAR